MPKLTTTDELLDKLRSSVDVGNLTFRALASEIDVPFTTIADWARRRSVPPLDRAERLAHALGYRLELNPKKAR